MEQSVCPWCGAIGPGHAWTPTPDDCVHDPALTENS